MRQEYEDGDGDCDEDEANETNGHGDDDIRRRLVHMRMVTIRLLKRGSSQPTSVPWANISKPIRSCPKENVLNIFTKML